MSGKRLKGAVGEHRVWRWANALLPRSRYRHFHDLRLVTPTSRTRIDHAFLSREGVFVVETKNFDGWIRGKAGDDRWTQTFANGERHMFRNPLRQNDWHARVLADVCTARGIDHFPIHSVVVFVGSAELKTALPGNVRVGSDFARYIRSFRAPVLSQGQVGAIQSAIEAARI